MISFGVVQGRLVQSPNGELQCFPGNLWPDEFVIAKENGIKFIELLAEREHNQSNPLWSSNGREEILQVAKSNGIDLYSSCTDYIINHNILQPDKDSLSDHVYAFIDVTAKLGCKNAIFPLLEASNISSDNLEEFFEPIKEYADYAAKKNVSILLETLLSSEDLLYFLESLNHPNVQCVFDTGNRVQQSKSLSNEIKLLGQYIKHVHIKDKDSSGENVILGTGLVNFYEVFKALYEINYSGPFVFETTRGNDPVSTVNFHMNICKFFYDEARNK